ncbi:MAG TPA: ABC transporter permease [Acidobacteriota bacterium]|nr:ABC transporter permease [Acidobacteriota bacterium]
MHFVEGAIIALEALWANKLRTFLTLLGNIVGVMSVIAVVSIIDGMNSYMRTEVASEGSGVFRVQQVNELDILSDFEKFLKSLHNPKITIFDVAQLRERVTLADYMDVSQGASTDVRYQRHFIKSVGIQGRTENYPLLGRWELKDGRHFTAHEVQHAAPVAVVGFDIADRMFPDADPLGKTIKLAGIDFNIVGVLQKRGGVLGGNPNLTVVIPVTSLQKIFGTHNSVTISIKSANLEQTRECIDQVRLIMRGLRHLGPKREDNFAIVTSDNLLSLWDSISKGIFAALIGIVSISLVVGGIVIMNIMLVSVTERTREIGIRKAVGATRLNVLWQFLVEAITLSSVGGILGILFGFGTAALVAYFSPLPYAIKLWSIFAGLGVTFAVGVFFGAYPALQAARLDPIEALRYE